MPPPIAATTITMMATSNGVDDEAGGTAGTSVAVAVGVGAAAVDVEIIVAAAVELATAAAVEVAVDVAVTTGAVDTITNTAAVRPGTVKVPVSILKSAVRTTGSLESFWMGWRVSAMPAKAGSEKV